MLLSKLRYVLCLFLCVGFFSGNAQVYDLVQELKRNSRKMSLAGVKDPARDKPYEISASGNVISFYKTVTTVMRSSSPKSDADISKLDEAIKRMDKAIKSGKYSPREVERFKDKKLIYESAKREGTRSGSTQSKTERKLMASLSLSKVSPSSMNVIERSDRVMLDLKGNNVLRYYDATSKTYKHMNASIIHLYNSTDTWKLANILQKAVFTAVPKRNMNLRCSGNAKILNKVGISVRAILSDGRYIDIDGGRFVVRGSVGTYVIKNVPIGAKIGVWINYPSGYSGENSDSRIPKPNKIFMMASTIASWNKQKSQMGGATFSMDLK